MGERFDKADDKPTVKELGFPAEYVAGLVSNPLDKVSDLSERFKSSTDKLLEDTVANSKLARYALVTAEGLAYTVPGVVNGVYHNLSNLPELGFKMATAATIGIGMRLLLPQKGAARAVVGTTMGYFFIRDALHPIMEAYDAVADAKDVSEVHAAAKKMGDGLGLFAVDSYIGIKVGIGAERATGRFLKTSTGSALLNKIGFKDATHFETAKETFFNSDKHFHGRALNAVARTADKVCGTLAEKLMIRQERQRITLEEALKKVDEAGKRTKHSIEDGGFYKYGPKVSENGQRMNFSEYVDNLLAGNKPAEPTATVSREIDIAPRFTPDSARMPRRVAGANPETLGAGGELPVSEIKAPGGDARPPAPAGPLKPVTGETVAEFDPANLAKLSNHAKRVQGAWGDEAIQIADLRDGFQSPVKSLSDGSRKGAILGPEYDASAKQLIGLAEQVQTVEHLKEAGFVLDLHAKAASQEQLGLPAVRDLNMFAEELHGIFVGGLRKAGVTDNVLSGKVPSRVALTNDQGSGNFTIPNIDGVIERPVTVMPRNQTGLLSVFAGINRHEQIGHDHVYGDLAKFPAELRDTLIGQAIKNAMQAAGIADTNMTIPGIKGEVPKSKFFELLLKAEANENTADIVGTATGGPDTALSLGVLLQSLRKGGQLETRNVLGSAFDDFIEPHGIDRWRVKLCAEVMRQLGNGDKKVDNMANALDNYAARAARPGDSYVWASADDAFKGQAVSIPMSEWDAVIPHIVKAQLDTPLQSLEGKSFRQILPDMAPIVGKIDTLAGHIADTVGKGKESLAVPFDKNDYTIGQVFSAGLLGWMRATARGEDPARALGLINKISEGMRSEYRSGNPHQVQIAPTQLQALRRQPLKVAYDMTGRILQKQTGLREGTARLATHMGSAATYLLMEDIMQHNRMRREMERQAGH